MKKILVESTQKRSGRMEKVLGVEKLCTCETTDLRAILINLHNNDKTVMRSVSLQYPE